LGTRTVKIEGESECLQKFFWKSRHDRHVNLWKLHAASQVSQTPAVECLIVWKGNFAGSIWMGINCWVCSHCHCALLIYSSYGLLPRGIPEDHDFMLIRYLGSQTVFNVPKRTYLV
jgi:hypothetical protein